MAALKQYLPSLLHFLQVGSSICLISGVLPSILNGIVLAQSLPITPDASLGTERSIVIPATGNTSANVTIEGGAVRDSNLFHSFTELNVNTRQQVQFRPDASIESIFTRVTGNAHSQILGTLGISGDADLFLINPNGIFFGPDAELNLNGSFLASTADGVQFGDDFLFSTQTLNPPPTILLDIQPSALLFNRPNPSPINSQAQLEVDFGETFQLVGGDIRIADRDEAIVAREGLIELAGSAGPGRIELSPEGTLQLSDNTERADITLSRSTLNVANSQDGDITIYGGDILIEGARLIAGYRERQNAPNSQAGDITLDATGDIIAFGGNISNSLVKYTRGNSGNITLIAEGDIRLRNARIQSELRGTGNSGSITVEAGGELFLNGTRILNVVTSSGQGNSGDITIEAAALRMETPRGNSKTQQAEISTGTEGQGNAGSIFIDVDQFTMIGPGRSGSSGITANSSQGGGRRDLPAVGNAGSIFINVNGPFVMTQRGKIESAIQRGATGNGGDIEINAQSLSLEDVSFIQVQSRIGANGYPGNITINLEESLNLSKTSFITTSIDNSVVIPTIDSENHGNIIINADAIRLWDLGFIAVQTAGPIDAGRIQVTANVIDVRDTFILGEDVPSSSGFFSRSRPSAEGAGGDIVVRTRLLHLRGNSVINASTESSSPGGNINVTAERIDLVDGGQIIASTFGQGEAGSIEVRATEEIVLSGNDPTFALQVEDAEQRLRRRRIRDLRQVIHREGVNGLVTGDNPASSGIFVSAQPAVIGDAGELIIVADTLIVENGAQISANNFGSGSGQTTEINARQFLIRDGGMVGAGSLIVPGVDPAQLGPGGTLIINVSEEIELSGRGSLGAEIVNSQLFTRAEGAGPAGNLIINETPNSDLSVIIRDGAEISASTVNSMGGNIIFNNPDLVLLRAGGRISAEAGLSQGAGDGGNIALIMPDGFLVSVPNEDSDIIANAFLGNGGNINITAQGIFNLVERPAIQGNGTNDVDASARFGQSGTVTINNLNPDPTQNFIELPTDTATPTVAQRCLADSQGQSAFIVTGQGGTSPTPQDIVRNETTGLVDFGNDTPINQANHSNDIATAAVNPVSMPSTAHLIEAQRWQRDHTGNIVLIAQTHPPIPPVSYSAVCSQTRR